jgi:ATP-dependent DNA helicase RecQ
MRVIAVGDDDQNIYEFRGASSKYLEQFITGYKAEKYELNDNFRSKRNLVEFTNLFVAGIRHRLKEIPIVSNQKDNGNVRLIRYFCNCLIIPTVKDVLSTDLTGTTCVLTQTNDEALQVTGLLIDEGRSAKLIQTNEGFNLYNLLEVRYFIEQLTIANDTYSIGTDIWHEAKRKLWYNYKESTKIDICINLVKEFELSNPRKKYKTDFDVFIRESKLEDFISTNGETIFVSTIHKAKGKEFDNVFIMLNGFNPETDEKKRLLYVAMTRAKRNLSVHLNGNYLDAISSVDLQRKQDKKAYADSKLLVIHLTHKDIWLDYFISRQNRILNLKCGDRLAVNNEGCIDCTGNCIVRFSNGFKEKIAAFESKGYKLKSAVINYIVYWKKEDTDKEIKIILPELKLLKE